MQVRRPGFPQCSALSVQCEYLTYHVLQTHCAALHRVTTRYWPAVDSQCLPLAHSMSRHLRDPGPDLGSLQVLGPGLNMTHSTPSLTHTHHPVQPVQCSTVQSHSISDKCNENVHILSSATDDKSSKVCIIPTHAVQWQVWVWGYDSTHGAHLTFLTVSQMVSMTL